MEARKDGWMDGCISRIVQLSRCMNGMMIRWEHGWIIRLILGWNMGWKDRWRYVLIYENLEFY